METKIIKAIIIDDEYEACLNLKNIIENYVRMPQLQIAGMAQDTADAERLIAAEAPDVVFIDIDMPSEDAFAFLERIAPVPFEVIFITAYDEYAIQAVKIHALDYILKPVSITEVRSAIEKLVDKFSRQGVPDAAAARQDKAVVPQTLKLRTTRTLDIVAVADIVFLEARGAYSYFYTVTDGIVKEIMVSRPIAQFQEILLKSSFFR
ncbi:MAG: response regulator transcription factor, partial [Chitinophagaceae bacterium]|nr:response regulator transcription factor [Chitinophagaceae bacterium]